MSLPRLAYGRDFGFPSRVNVRMVYKFRLGDLIIAVLVTACMRAAPKDVTLEGVLFLDELGKVCPHASRHALRAGKGSTEVVRVGICFYRRVAVVKLGVRWSRLPPSQRNPEHDPNSGYVADPTHRLVTPADCALPAGPQAIAVQNPLSKRGFPISVPNSCQ